MSNQYGSPAFQFNSTEWKFIARRILFLFIGWLATILLSEIIPFIQELNASWSGITVLLLTALAEFLAKFAKNNNTTRIVGCLALFLLSINNLAAQIVAKEKYEPHQPITVTLEAPDSAQVLWSYNPKPSIITSGKTQYIWASPGKYKIEAIVINVDFDTRVFDIQRYDHTFEVTGSPAPVPGPTPTPGPVPGPTPVPGPNPVPTDKYNIGKFIYDEAIKLDPVPRALAAQLANNFQAVSAGIFAGQFRDGGFTAAQDDLAKRNAETLTGPNLAAWAPVFDKLAAKTKELRVPTTLNSYAEYYDLISKGLQAVR